MARIPKCRCHLLRSHRRSRAWCCISCASTVVGVLQTVLQMIENGDTHIGVATDHVIESFRNRLWAGYKTGAGLQRALPKQVHPLEAARGAMGVVVWPMIELEADDALASAAHIAAKDKKVQKVAIWTPDK